MDSSKPGLDLEKELTCSICTELLYHPLTLLDCLHTFCGACLKDWFTWQAHAAENAPDPPAPGTSVFTCPSCRAPVRDTRHNATVASLLDMVLVAHPEKAKPASEKEEMDAKYRPGDGVLPKLNIPERTAEQLRLEERERNLIESVREMSLLEAVNGEASASRSRQHGSGSRSRNGSSHRTRDTSATRTGDVRSRERQHRRRPTTERDSSLRTEHNARLSPDHLGSRSEHSRNSSNESRRRNDDLRERQRRQIEHQSSLRSLISSSDGADIDMEREVEEFARQIQQEGLLDGLDLENIDLINNDELSPWCRLEIGESTNRAPLKIGECHKSVRGAQQTAYILTLHPLRGSRAKKASESRQRKQRQELNLASGPYAARDQGRSSVPDGLGCEIKQFERVFQETSYRGWAKCEYIRRPKQQPSPRTVATFNSSAFQCASQWP
ncbi:hypothetical protein J7T55_009260 [Diaporthe amygdali]|uniref:uncharacterized protein n=1 Tax=Phomopsis amygdali TaxID=1214568 RepID=UPI0022FF0F83|nr:uncharacterized protein J7T55_009260 [Diaporthe amygdali]KAJ0118477.1 hypothetical protein J7T55_009260 [Diaporthe amygdali]